LLVLATAEAYNAPIENALIPACTLELIHTYSLIHDDLPCMDDDDMRRGKPTVHKIYGEGHAVLTGDYLLTYAFQILSEAKHLSPEQKLQLIRCLAFNAGADGMVGGQVVDLLSENKTIDWATLKFMDIHKTAALISTALEFGAIIGGAPPDDHLLLSEIGKNLGLAFQIVDDILDAGEETDKTTVLSFLSVQEAEALASTLYTAACDKLKALSVPTPGLSLLAQKLVFRCT
jgi:geranylgeranyl diphosphate synthase type II